MRKFVISDHIQKQWQEGYNPLDFFFVTMLFFDDKLFYMDDMLKGIKLAEINLGIGSFLSNEWDFLQSTKQKRLKYNKYTREVENFPK